MWNTLQRALLTSAAVLLLAAPAFAASESAAEKTGKAMPPHYDESLFPPWQHGANNDALVRAASSSPCPKSTTWPTSTAVSATPKLVLYVGGNYFFAMAPLVKTFEERTSRVQGAIVLGDHPTRACW